jgi:glycerol uptake facilitator-like aquaporin
MNIMLVVGAFSAALLSRQFSPNRPPPLEYLWAASGGSLLGIGAALAGGCTTGGFFNPARFLGPAIVFGCDLGNIWVYVPAQFFGGLLAGLTHKFVLAKEPVVQITSEAVSLSPLSLSHLHLNDRLYNNAHL